MATLEDSSGLPPVPEGQVNVEALLTGKWAGWLRVSIGRRKYTKRFMLSPEEATLLVDGLVVARHAQLSPITLGDLAG